jgi:hypothetical protein
VYGSERSQFIISQDDKNSEQLLQHTAQKMNKNFRDNLA